MPTSFGRSRCSASVFLLGAGVGVALTEAKRKALIVRPLRERRRLHLRAHPPEPEDIVFLGDSLIHGAEWAVHFPRLAVRNFGIAGDTTTDVLERLGDVTCGDPCAVALMIGTNDVTRGTRARDAVSGVLTIVRELKRACPSTAVVVHTLLPRQRRYRRWICDVNDGLRETALPLADALIDLYSTFADGRGCLRADLTNDRLHLLPRGYTLWKEHLSPVLGQYARG